jgi:hypothetical protein
MAATSAGTDRAANIAPLVDGDVSFQPGHFLLIDVLADFPAELFHHFTADTP